MALPRRVQFSAEPDAEAAIEKLKPYSTCDISDALLKLKHPLGGFCSGISMWSPMRQDGDTKIIGPAHTVKFVLRTENKAPYPKQHYIDSIPSGSVLFISVPKEVENAAFGGMMTRRARYQGVVGAIVDGNIRDLGEQRALGFPVFAHDVSTPAYYEFSRPSEINGSITLRDGRTVVEAGDLIVADLNGVVCVPKKLISKVVDMVPGFVEIDAKIEAEIEKGLTVTEANKKHGR